MAAATYEGDYLCAKMDDQELGRQGGRLIAKLFNMDSIPTDGHDKTAPFDVISTKARLSAEVKVMRRTEKGLSVKPSMKHSAKARKLLDAEKTGHTFGTYVPLVDEKGMVEVFERPGIGEFRLNTMRHVCTVDTNTGLIQWHQRWLFDEDRKAFEKAAKVESAKVKQRSQELQRAIRHRKRTGIGAGHKGRAEV